MLFLETYHHINNLHAHISNNSLLQSVDMSQICQQATVTLKIEVLAASVNRGNFPMILLMEEILHHLGCVIPCK